jgi:hypothetical protein
VGTRTSWRAAWRASEHETAVREALTEGDTAKALNIAIGAVQAEAAKVRRRRPADAALADAALAALLLDTAARLHAHKPPRPAGARGVPQVGDLVRVFDKALQKAREEAGDE